MARSRTKKADTQTDAPNPADDTSFDVETFDAAPPPDPAVEAERIVHGLAEQTRLEPALTEPSRPEPDQPRLPDEPPAGSHSLIANPSSTRRPESHASRVNRLPSTLGVPAGDLIVKLIDKGDNRAGIGIRIDTLDGRTLSDEEKQVVREIVRGDGGDRTGFEWRPEIRMWHKPIIRQGEHPADVPPSRPVAIRLDAENRVQALAEALRELQADPVGFADRVQQRREQAAEAGRIPD